MLIPCDWLSLLAFDLIIMGMFFFVLFWCTDVIVLSRYLYFICACRLTLCSSKYISPYPALDVEKNIR